MPDNPTCICGGKVRTIVERSLPDSATGANAFHNLLGIAPPDWWRWSVTECVACGSLDFFREPRDQAEQRVAAAHREAQQLRQKLAALGQ